MVITGEENEKIVLRFIDALASKDLKTMDSIIHNDYEIWKNQTPVSQIDNLDPKFDFAPGKKGFLDRMKKDFDIYSKVKVTIKAIISNKDQVWSWYQASSIHSGKYLEIPPTNQLLEFDFIRIYQMKDGQIISAGGVRQGSFLFQVGKMVVNENEETTVQKYMDQLKQQGLIN